MFSRVNKKSFVVVRQGLKKRFISRKNSEKEVSKESRKRSLERILKEILSKDS